MRAAMPALLPSLRGYARALCRDAQAADDLVQDTILRALAAEIQWQPGTNLRAWLFTILRNAWLSGLRRRRESELTEGHTLAAAAPQMGRMELADLAAAMAQLPAVQREALTLVGAQGFSVAEAAEICAVPEGTIKARMSRGRDKLRRLLGSDED